MRAGRGGFKEHSEADDGSIDEETANDRHNHRRILDLSAMRKEGWKGCNDPFVSKALWDHTTRGFFSVLVAGSLTNAHHN